MLTNVLPVEQLKGIAGRKSKPDEYKSVRNPLVEEEVAKGWAIVKKGRTTTRLSKTKSHDRTLEDRVWTLLYRMGFKHLSGQGGAQLLVDGREPDGPDNQIDVVAVDDEVSFAIECKSCETPRKFQDFSKDLAKHVALRERFTRAIRDKIPVENKRTSVFAFWTSGMIVTDNDRTRSDANHVQILEEKDLDYYEQLVGQVGSAARFQFLADVLSGRSVPGLEITVPAIRSRMKGGSAMAVCKPLGKDSA